MVEIKWSCEMNNKYMRILVVGGLIVLAIATLSTAFIIIGVVK